MSVNGISVENTILGVNLTKYSFKIGEVNTTPVNQHQHDLG